MGKSYWTTSFYNRISSTKGNFIIFLIYCPVKVDNLFMFSNIVYVNVSTRLVLRLLHNSDITRQFWDKSLREHEEEDHTISNKYGRSRFLYYFRVEIYIIFELPRCHMIPQFDDTKEVIKNYKILHRLYIHSHREWRLFHILLIFYQMKFTPDNISYEKVLTYFQTLIIAQSLILITFSCLWEW